MPERDLTVHPLTAYPGELGAALWMLEDTRHRTLEAVDGLADDLIDLVPTGAHNAIGTILYHLAAIEADWLYADILVTDYPGWMAEVFPHDVREESGRLTPVAGESLDGHLSRLALVRGHLLEELRVFGEEGYRRPRRSESGTVTPEWVLHHLRQHEAEHRGQLQAARTLLED